MDIINKKLNINILKTNLFKNIAFYIFIIFLFFISINGTRAATGVCSTIATTTTTETITNTPCEGRTSQTSCTATPHYNGQGYKSVCSWTSSGGGNTTSNVTVSSQPNVVDYNGKAAVFWSAPGASYCAIPGNGHAPPAGPNSYFNTPPLKENTTFTVTCYGLNQTLFGTGSVLVQVRTSDRITDTLTQKHATNITDTEAVLTGSLVPGGVNSSGYFRYSVLDIPPIFCNDIFGSNMKATNEVNLGSGTGPITFQTKINELIPNTKYYFCAVGSNKKDISYGGVGSFTTSLEKAGSLFIETEDPRPKDSYSAYLNGKYSSNVSSKTWFEFRKISKKDASNQWIKTNERSRNIESDGKLEFLLGGLTPGTTYETRAAIIRIGIAGPYEPIYGAIKTFKTKDANNVGAGGIVGGGIGYEDPCININDPNCNGTGGGGILPITGGTTNQLPDLVASSVTISSNVVNTPITLYSTIRNQGNGTTLNIKPVESIQNTNVSPVSFLKNLLKSNKVLAAASATNQVAAFEKGNFYSFFQISTRNPDLYINTIQNTSNTPATSFIKNFLKTDVAVAANTTNTPTIDNTLIDLPFILVKTLNSKSSSVITQDYIFSSVGTYYVRACADKKNRTDAGLIKELYENNNCGAWKAIAISNTSSCPTGWTGTPPNCISPGGGGLCPSGWTGVFPNCINPGGGNSCPAGWTGTPPNCVSPPGGGFCPNGWTGVFPNCTPGGTSCPSGWTGVYPNCISPGGSTGGGGAGGGTGGGSSGGTGGGSQPYQNPSGLVLGQIATPPPDAIVRYREGIETVLARQIMRNTQLAKEYGYEEGSDLQAFAWYLSHYFATIFGYVGDNGKEIRVGAPDIAAYQIDLSNRILTIYEYYDSKIVNIQKMTPSLRKIYGYEYYFKK